MNFKMTYVIFGFKMGKRLMLVQDATHGQDAGTRWFPPFNFGQDATQNKTTDTRIAQLQSFTKS